MNEKNSLQTSPQLENHEQRDALALSPKQAHSLYKKSKSFGIPFDVLEEVYKRGFEIATNNKEQAGFNRVDSFIHGGEAARLDEDLKETVVQGEPQSDNPDDPSARFVGTDSLTNILKSQTPGQTVETTADVVKRVVRDAIAKKEEDK
jgi:hypothetical protein